MQLGVARQPWFQTQMAGSCRHRVHSSLGGDSPAEVSENGLHPRAQLGNFRWQSHCRGLYQLPMAA